MPIGRMYLACICKGESGYYQIVCKGKTALKEREAAAESCVICDFVSFFKSVAFKLTVIPPNMAFC